MSTLNYLNTIWEQSHKKLIQDNNYRKIFNYCNKNSNFKNKNDKNVSSINFSSNDYLGLRQDVRVTSAGYKAARISGSGSGASRSVLQTDSLIEELEQFFCTNTNFKHALFLPSGFIANLTFFDVLSPFSFEELEQEFFIDHRCHASIFFSLKNTGIRSFVFRHNDMSHLEKKLKASSAQAKIIVIESLFSMDGDFSLAAELTLLCEKYNAVIFVDESHSFGIFGNKGSGWVHEYPDLKKYLIAATFGCGKSVGVSGGFFATNCSVLKERILQKSKLFIYSTGISPFITGAVYQSLKIIFSEEGDLKRKLLFDNINYLLNNIASINFQFQMIQEKKRHSQIFPFIFYENEKTIEISNHLMENNILAKAIRPPSVPNHTARLRLCLTSLHTKEEIDLFILNLNKILKN